MTSTNFNSPVTGVAHGEKPEKFGGVDFKRWQQKMLFYLTTLKDGYTYYQLLGILLSQ